MPPSNTGAWLTAAKRPLEIKSAPYTAPKGSDVVIRNKAVAINPVDWMTAENPGFIYKWLKLPFLMLSDVAGEVVEVGPEARFKVGDRVTATALGMCEKVNNTAYGGSQEYVVLYGYMTAKIPDSLSYEQACVIPLGLNTAACGLFQKDMLGLNYPTSPRAKSTGETVLILGGSTSVGCNAIQLAVAAGYEVITTASPKNFALTKKLGASQVFDYRSKTIVLDLINAFKGKKSAGALTMGHGSADIAMDVLHKVQGNKFIAMATYPVPEQQPKNFAMIRIIYAFASWMFINFFRSRIRGISFKFIFGDTLVWNEVGKAVFEDFLGPALADGSFVPAPDAEVVGKGLEAIQGAFDVVRKGVSAKKIVVSL